MVILKNIISYQDLERIRIENKDKKISIRTREGKDLGQLNLSHFLISLKEEIDKKE